MFLRRFLKLFFVFLGMSVFLSGILSPQYAFADDVAIAAAVDRRTVELGDSLQFTITVSNYQDVTPIQLPPIDGFDSRYLGPATHVSIMNGHYSSSTTLMYRLYPSRTGKFTIPAITFTLGGKDYTTDPVMVEVVDAGTIKQPAPSAAGGQAAPVSLHDKLFVVMSSPKNEYFIGEPVPVTIKLFVNNISVRNAQYPTFDYTGFTADNFQPVKKYAQAIGGIEYQVVEFNAVVYPTRTGDLTLGPAKMVCNVLFKDSSGRASPFSGFFDDEFLNSFFDNGDIRPVTVESTDLKIKALPLPGEGKPQGFSGAVGNFDFTMSVGPSEVKVGDPLTVKMKLRGEGNLKSLSMPTISDTTAFKLYDPQVTDQPGEKALEQVVIPKSDSVKEVPAVTFSYFDSQAKQYKTITRGPFSIVVRPLEKGEEAKVIGLESKTAPSSAPREETLGRDIVFIKELPGTILPAGFVLFQSGVYWAMVLLFLGMWVVLFRRYQLTHRLKTDAQFARRLQAPQQARLGLAQAKSQMQKGQQKEFYDTIFQVLQKYFANKGHLSLGTVNRDAVVNLLQKKGLSTAVGEKVRQLFDECEMVRYASQEIGPEKMANSYQQAEEIIDYLERNWR